MSANKNVESRYLIMSYLTIDFTMKKKSHSCINTPCVNVNSQHICEVDGVLMVCCSFDFFLVFGFKRNAIILRKSE